ncbi:glycoside hydrolase family 1 protein [Kitasatospora sp. NPDC004615]|uniref:glycoside hydrolase family 1 protein n=1 Tax=Kitasatospora sp. NPDC004615 TaxID=3364017 RepID=UPI00369F9A47
MTGLREDFLWGASTSPHQIEGNNVNADWWATENAPTSPFPDRSGDAVDSYHRYAEDMRLLADAGLNAYRFGFEWARIEPADGHFSRAERDHYRRMVDTAHELGLAPVVTLQHFTLPRWFAESGGWRRPDAADRFARYIEFVSTALRDVDWVCTINEPNMLAVFASVQEAYLNAMMGQQAGKADTGQAGGQAATELATALAAVRPDRVLGDTLAKVHRRAVEVVRATTNAKAGWTVAQQSFTPTPGNEGVFERIHHGWEGFYLDVAREDDFVGVQAYTSQPVDADGPVPHPAHPDNTLTGWAYRPDALGTSLRRAWDEAGGIPLLVTENGIATNDDTRRIAYTGEALGHLEAAAADGVDVRGYLHWSALDNYEWGRYAPTFGLIAVDRETFVRTPKPSLAWLGARARAHRNGPQ